MATTIEQGTQERWAEDRSNNNSNNNKQSEFIHLPDLAGIVYAGWYKILFCVIVGWVMAGAYYVTAPSAFESKAELYVMYNDPSLAASGVGKGADSNSVSEDLLATQMQIIQSRRILNQVLERGEHPISEMPSLVAELKEGQSAVDYLNANLTVSRGGEGQARGAHSLTLKLRHTSPQGSKMIVEALLAEYNDYVKNKFQDVNADAAVLIDQARSELEFEMEKAREEYAAFRMNADPLWSGENSTNVHRLRYEQIQNELSLMSLQLGEAETRLRVVKDALDGMDIANTLEFDMLALIDEKNAARIGVMLTVSQGSLQKGLFAASQPERGVLARSEYSDLLSLQAKREEYAKLHGWGPSHPQIVSLDEQIGFLQKFLSARSAVLDESVVDFELGASDVLSAYVKLLENDVIALQARITDLEKESVKEEAATKELISEELRGIALQDKIAHQQGLQEAVVERLKGINIGKEFGGVQSDVIAYPEVGRTVWPKLPICLAVGTMLGFVLGGGWIVLSEFGNRSFRSSEEIKSVLDTQILSHVPNLRHERDYKLLAELKKNKSLVSPSIYAHHLPKSVNAEVFRGLRTSILFKCQNGEKVFSVTSPNQGDGKSTLIANLASSVAQTDRKVLIVDCDMRRPSVHRLMGLENSQGLANVIEHDLEPWDLIQETEIPNLSVLTTGKIPHNPAELLETGRFRNLLELLRERFDFVLLDCPPVLAVADPSIVCPLTDGCILLVNVARDARADALHAKSTLDSVRASIMGVVIVGAESKKARGYSGTYGRYGGQYGGQYGGSGGNQSYYSETS